MRKFNWYYRQKVGYEDMRALQDNLEEAIQNTILDLFATGFVSGGVVQPTSPASMSVQVTAGRGYDESGNRIFVPSVQTIDLSSYRPSTSGRERWVLVAARFKRVESDPRTDGHGTMVMYRSDPSFEIVVRAGSEAATGSAQKPAKQAGDVIRGYVRVYAGQSTVTASDISVAEAENLTRAAAHEVRYGSETVESALNARLPSAGEKAALAGTAGTPSSSNRYVTNSDPRLTDARTPKAHASTHKAGGSDPLTPEDIGAAPASHSHSWSEITNKPSTFPPSSHQHSASDVTSGTFPVARGGTGLSSLTAGSYLRAASSSAFELRTPAQVLSDIGAAPASHTHSPADVGLGNVQNYGIATQAEAEAGIVNNKYMTPLRVAQAIAALSAKSQVVVATGSVQNGGTVPLPSGYTQDQCWWMVTVGSTGALNQYFAGFRCYTDTNRKVTAQWWDHGVSQWKNINNVNYIIIGVK